MLCHNRIIGLATQYIVRTGCQIAVLALPGEQWSCHRVGKSRAPLCIRLTPEERGQLEQLAGTMSLAGYIKMVVLEGQRPSRISGRTRHDQQALAKVLAALGASELSASLERLSYAAANGSLYVDDRLAAKFAAACDDIRAMHLHLLEALGKKAVKNPSAKSAAIYSLCPSVPDERTAFMILVGSQRGGAGNLARHLLNDKDNDHVSVHELCGFTARDLKGAFEEAHAISLGTNCKQFLSL